MKPVIIPYDDKAKELIQSMENADYPRSLARKLQRYSVSVYPNEWNGLYAAGSIEVKADLFPVLIDTNLYKLDTGLWTEVPIKRGPEELIL